MELRQIKRINNIPRDLPKYNFGADGNPLVSNSNWLTGQFDQSYKSLYGSSYSAQPQYTPKLNSAQINNMISSPYTNPTQQSQPSSGIDVFELGGHGNGSYKDNQVEIKASAGQKVAGVIGGIADIAGGVLSTQSAVKGEGEMMANAGTTNGNIGGVGYVRQNYINEDAEKDAVNGAGLSNTIGGVAKGASAGAVFGPIGAGVGAVIGGIANIFSWGSAKRKLKRRLENARQLTARMNTGAQAGAMTTALQQEYYSENGNDGGILYANKGKDRYERRKSMDRSRSKRC